MIRTSSIAATLSTLLTLMSASDCRAQVADLSPMSSQFALVEAALPLEGMSLRSSPATGSIVQGVSEELSLELSQGLAYQIIGVCDDCTDLDLVLRGPSGEMVAQDLVDDDVAILHFVAASAGAYTVEVVMASCPVGPCSWGVQLYGEDGAMRRSGHGSAPQARSNTDSRFEGTLTSGDARMADGSLYDTYRVDVREGQTLTVDMTSDRFDTYLIVRSPSGREQENDDHLDSTGHSRLQVHRPEVGTWTVVATSYGADVEGSYRVDVTLDDDRAASPREAVPSSADERHERGSLAPGDPTLPGGEYLDEFTFTGNAGEEVTFDLRSSEFDPYLIVRGPDGLQEDNDDHQGAGDRSLVRLRLPSRGDYTVGVTSAAPAQTGAYDLRIRMGVAASAGSAQREPRTIELDREESGVLDDGDARLEGGEYHDLWVFEGSEKQTVRVELSSQDFDTYLVLLSPEGDVLDENDDVDGRTDVSRIELQLPGSGRYRVVATSYAVGEAGRYELTLRTGAEEAAPSISRAGDHSGPHGQVYGVFVGVSDYGGRASDLAYTAEDAHRAAEAMVAGGGMLRDNAIVLTDADATVDNVRDAFARMGRRVGPDDTFVYFYSGHGARLPRSAPERSDPDALDETIELYDGPIRDNEMSDLLALVEAEVSLVVLDACFSGGFSKDVISAPGRMGFFSSEEDVTSQVAAKFRAGGYLAQFVFDGVGGRLADADGDGGISAIELSQYIHERYRSDVKSASDGDYVDAGGPQTGFQHFVADRGSISPDRVLFR